MKIKERMQAVLELLDKFYEIDTKCYLHYNKPHELLVATILSAQCTDDRVNIVTKTLFKKYQSVEDFASASPEELSQDIKSTGFYNNKAKNIILANRALLEKYNGIVPDDIDKLTGLAGVGRKTANVIRGNIFQIPSIVVDTHVKRISYRLGFTKNTDPVKIEFDLMKLLPKDHWIRYNHQIIAHGRAICTARRAKCENCVLTEYCPKKEPPKASSKKE